MDFGHLSHTPTEETIKVENLKYHHEVRKLNNIVKESDLKTRFFKFEHEEAEKEWKDTKEKLDKKGKHLEKKYKGETKMPDTVEHIKVSDKALGETKYTPEPVVLNIDKNTISENVKQALNLHPKFATPVPVNLIEAKTEIQKGFYKQRMSIRKEEERKETDETEEEAEKNDAKAHELVDKDTKTINFNNLRPTDLPTNK